MRKFILAGLAVIFFATVAVCAEMPENHDKMWEFTHGLKAKLDISSCTVCHSNEKTCLDCHKVTFGSKKKPLSHTGDYVILHRLDAKRDASSCTTCHERGSNYCLKCHQSLNKAASTSNASPAQPKSHEAANWRTALHAAHAKRALSKCQSCHPDLYTVSPCTTCHSGKTNISGNPHPSNFKASQFQDKAVCYKCHGNGVDGPSAGPLTL